MPIFSPPLMVVEFWAILNFSKTKCCKTCLGPLLPPGSKKWQLMLPWLSCRPRWQRQVNWLGWLVITISNTFLPNKLPLCKFSLIPISWTKVSFRFTHRHLRKIDWLMARTACLVCLISTVSGHSKKKKAKNVLLVVGT